MSPEKSLAEIELSPNQGWHLVRLGDSQADVQAALEQLGVAYDNSLDPCCFEIDNPSCTLQFVGRTSPVLAQIVTSDERARINGMPVLHANLDEALVALGVRSFSDTLWSMVDIDSEYNKGKPISDSRRPTSAKPMELLDGGTLWIKSLGVGLCMGEGQVDSIALRLKSDIPLVGCGPLDPQTITSAGSPTIEQDISDLDAKRRRAPWLGYRAKRFLQSTLVTIVALVLSAVAPTLLFVRYQGWKNATHVDGKVVDVQYDGPFVDHLIVQYALPDKSMRRAKVLPQFTGARETGQVVELCYLPSNPDHAVTPQESHSEFLSGYLPYGLVAGPFLSLMLLLYALPQRQ